MSAADRIEIVVGNIVTLDVDAIVNAANTSLLGGGGVDGAIHRAAGSELVQECYGLHGCKPGQAKLTKGYKLPAGHVIHTVGPVWNGGDKGEPETLKACYVNSLTIAAEKRFTTVAFPAISTGIYRYPPMAAAAIALKTTLAFLHDHAFPQQVIFCCFDQEMQRVYSAALQEICA
ncbi:O-acetyl-ADP-ribose deacetylase [Asticcacaulis sp. BYS171W]|uniref:O-acetyl-ADP-ribose deacetylase n=1 Tax=Asticcacaulis aquaticus TaxID=2984212 RepID=A0ABT5HUZ2_9CAUL|nr:O-acetyl-ADP-ribose deacetylase [Asticcacaulis aquaticus]